MIVPNEGDEIIKLQVGERHFYVSESTLVKYTNFAWKKADAEEHQEVFRERVKMGNEMVYFFDQDGDIFDHVVHFFRRKVVPTFVLPDGSVDKAKYSSLRDQAVYFGVRQLLRRIPEAWVDDEGAVQKPQLDGYRGTSCLGSDIASAPVWM